MHRFIDHIGATADRMEHGRRGADAFGDRHADIFQNRKSAKQPIDLEGARNSELDSLSLLLVGNIFAFEEDASARWWERAGKQIDERGLAGAVGSDQGMARAGSELEVDLLQGHKRAKAPAQCARFEPEPA